MAPQCCVMGCDRLPSSEDLTYFPFPISLSLRRTWRAVLPSSSNFTKDAMVCSRHFSAKDMETVRGKTRLKRKVVPTRFGQECLVREKSPVLSGTRTRSVRRTRANGRRYTEDSTTSEDEEDSESSQHSDPDFKVKPKPSKTVTSKVTKPADEPVINDEPKDEPNGEAIEEHNGETHDETISNDDRETNGDEMQVAPDISDMMEMLVNYGEEDKDKCTIECVPELMPPESGSSDEEKPHEDIEDIIANYHIKQDKELAERLLAAQAVERERLERERREKERKEKELRDKKEKDRQEQRRKETEITSSLVSLTKAPVKQKSKSVFRANRPNPIPLGSSSDDDCIDTTPDPNYVEIAVGGVDDCLMVMEDVQVLLDPGTLLVDQQDDGDPAESNEHDPVNTTEHKHMAELGPNADPISLLTSSDEDDVILQEPHIDTLEVSDETDEDDMPLTRIAQTVVKPVHGPTQPAFNPKMLWNANNTEFFCYVCHWKTNSRAAFDRHKKHHVEETLDNPDALTGNKREDDYFTTKPQTVMHMCELCHYSTASEHQMLKHRSKHRQQDKRYKTQRQYKCSLCDYRAKHRMSLQYHMRAHRPHHVDVSAPAKVALLHKPAGKYRCQRCKQCTNTEAEMLRHSRACPKQPSGKSSKSHRCKSCAYSTTRASDLRRHKRRQHPLSDSDDDQDYEP